MGSNDDSDRSLLEAKPQHEVILPTYYIARYPVTVAQFRTFVESSGHEPADKDCLNGQPYHPIVWVSWHDAMAYCYWLTRRLQEWPETPEPLAQLLRQSGGGVVLPSEAEWEKAARGTEGLVYPWGHDPDPNRANYNDSGIGATSSVGCFPDGASPYGVEELSGNVWEWTRSLEGDYPYPADTAGRAEREDLQVRDNRPRVWRGASFPVYAREPRCAIRFGADARLVDGSLGFRVVVAVLP
jgi:formylglycine-generating enzyme required for sulfatase activity